MTAAHGVSPHFQQRAAVVAVMSFLFFLGMMLGVYLRGHFGYFLLATAFLIVFLFTASGWWRQRQTSIEVYERGLVFGRSAVGWNEISNVSRSPDGRLILNTSSVGTITIPRTIDALNELDDHIRSRISG